MDKSNEAFEHLTLIKNATNIYRMMPISHHLLTIFLSFTLALSMLLCTCYKNRLYELFSENDVLKHFS